MADSNAKKLAQFLTASGTYNLYDVQADSTGFFDLPSGTTAQRPGTPLSGMIRFNTTIGKAEQYDGVSWQAIDGPPLLSSIDPTAIVSSDGSFDITLTGDNFSTNSTVVAIGQDASEISPTTVVRTDAQELVATFDGTDFDNAQEPYAIKVTNNTGLASTLAEALQVDASPVWSTASGSIGTIYDSGRGSVSLSVSATDPESESITYSVTTGSLPSGLSLNSSTGAITGSVSAVGSDTTTNFSITASDGSNDNERSFSITVKAPIIQSFTSTGSGSFSVPTGLTQVDVLVVAGGGSGGTEHAGGGGAGGLIYRPAFPVTPGGSVSYTVGAGANITEQTRSAGQGPAQGEAGSNGQNSVFGSLTALGGGGGGTYGGGRPGVSQHEPGNPGGSGGGGSSSPNPGTQPGGSATQPQQPGDSGTYGFGNSGGSGSLSPSSPNPDHGGGGGGGAGAAGLPSNNNIPDSRYNPGTNDGIIGVGGNGKQYDISGSQVYYAGGGGGSVAGNPWGDNPAGGLGGGGYGGNFGYPETQLYGSGPSLPNLHPNSPNRTRWSGSDGLANRGGGGGAGSNDPNSATVYGGAGGSGVVIVKY
jgi:hypothetical protein